MKKPITFILLLFLAVVQFGHAQIGPQPVKQSTIEDITIPDEVIIRLTTQKHPNDILNKVPRDYNLQIERLLSPPTNIWLLKFNPEEVTLANMVRDLNALPEIIAAQPNTFVDLREAPDDPFYSNQWHHQNINSEEAWDINTGGLSATGEDIVVCIIESANVMGHPDLVANHWTNTAEVLDGTDTDGNGYIDDINGWNVSTNNHNIGTGNHGTSVAGMIGAVGNNGVGVAGANWDVKMMVVAGYNQPFTQANIVEAYTYPLQARILWNNTNGAEGSFVVATNASWGIDGANPADYPIWCGFYDDLGEAGILNCGATTNANQNVDIVGDMPTACPSDYMVSVTATNINDIIDFAGYGVVTIDVAAPGSSIYTTNNSGYGTTSGTSFASPLTAGVIGLMYSIPCESFMTLVKSDPQGAADIVRQALFDGVDQSQHLIERVATGGRINAKTAMDILMDAVCVVNDIDVGVIAIPQPENGLLSSTETIEISIRNFGALDQSNFDVTYQVDGGTVVTETYAGTVTAGSIENYTFTTTADLSTVGQTYSITASTELTGDENTTNDSFTKEVVHLEPNDIGVTAVLEPTSGSGLTNAEMITIEITNFGGSAQSNFDVSYTIDALPAITETVTETIDAGETLEYTFTQTGDFSELGSYTLSATTLLANDSDTSNDEITLTINNTACQPESDCTEGDGLTKFVLAEINLPNIVCVGNGYIDNTMHAATLDASIGNYSAVIRSGFANQQFSAWIDYNDNGVFEPSEQIFQSVVVATANSDVNVPFTIPSDAPNGDHLMRVRGKWASGSGTLNDPCADLQYGNTVDFTATIINGTLGINENLINLADFIILSNEGNQFEAILTTNEMLSEEVSIKVHTILGQNIITDTIENSNGQYTYSIDMSGHAAGVYFVRVGTKSFGKVQRFVVK